MTALSHNEIAVMNMLVANPLTPWQLDDDLSMTVAMVCTKTGVMDAKELLQQWDNFWFQLELARRGLVGLAINDTLEN